MPTVLADLVEQYCGYILKHSGKVFPLSHFALTPVLFRCLVEYAKHSVVSGLSPQYAVAKGTSILLKRCILQRDFVRTGFIGSGKNRQIHFYGNPEYLAISIDQAHDFPNKPMRDALPVSHSDHLATFCFTLASRTQGNFTKASRTAVRFTEIKFPSISVSNKLLDLFMSNIV
jgi:hypothetical protein